MGDQTRPNVHTPPPGPRSQALMKRGEDIMLGVSLIGDWPPSHFVSRYRDGWFLEDVDGNRYIDWLAGWASSPLGGNNPELVEAAHTALQEYGTECLSSLTTWHQYELAEKLVEIAPGPLTKVVYDTTGSEVVENAVRIMREAAGPSRPFVITFLGSFHGGNYGTGAMGPHNAHYNHGIEPFMSGWINVPFPTCYRCPYHLDYPACDIACLGYVEEMILRYKATPDSIAGVKSSSSRARTASRSRRRSGPGGCPTSAGSTAGSSTTTRSRRAWAAAESGSSWTRTRTWRSSCSRSARARPVASSPSATRWGRTA